MIVDITNNIITRLDTDLTATVLNAMPSTTPSFPCVVVEEISNPEDMETVDSSGAKYSNVVMQIDIFTNSSKRVSDAKDLRNSIDSILSDEYGMSRDFAGRTPNLDDSIYRYTLRYSALIDSNLKIYRR